MTREEQIRQASIEYTYKDRPMCIGGGAFSEVTFENSPQEVEIKLKSSSSISESIVKEFMDTLNFTYDKSETCMTAKIYNSDLISLKNIINSRLG